MNVRAPGTRLITFLGGATILADGTPVRGRATHRHPLALLALLVVNGGKPMTRDKLTALLWPERDTDGARNLLKVNVHELRKELGEGAIRSAGDSLNADGTALKCDVLDFLHALARGDDRVAAELYSGPFLDGLFLKDAVEFERWVDAERTRLGDLYAAALERLADAAERDGDRDTALRWRRAHAVHEPYRPDVARRLIRALAAAGNAEGALQFAASFAERRFADLGIEDDQHLVTEARQLASMGTPPAPLSAIPAPAKTAKAPISPVLPVRVDARPAPVARRWLVAGAVVAALASVAAIALATTRGHTLVDRATIAKNRDSGPRTADEIAIERLARAAGEPDERIGGLTQRPRAAVLDYIAGDRAYRAARYATAESLYARALSADSTFGVAGLGLALANSWTGINEHYGLGRDAALKYQQTMSARDRAFALAFFGPDPATGAPRPAPVYLTAWEDVVEKWPDWTEAWYQLGDRFYHFGGLSGLADASERARTAFRRALSQDSTFAAPLHHLIEIYAARHETAALRATGARYFAANPSVDRNRSAIGWEMAMALGDSAWLRRVRGNFDVMPREDLTRIGWVTDANGWPRADARRAAEGAERRATVTSDREKSLISRFTLSLNEGQPAAARRAAAELGGIFPDAPMEALWNLYAALFGDGDSVLAASAAARLAPFAQSPIAGDHVRRDQHHQAACLLGYWSALRGDVAAAQSVASRVRSDLKTEDNGFARRNAEVCLAMLDATVAQRTRASDARVLVARLDTVLLSERVPPHVILETGTIVAGRLHAALGDTAAALVAARRREHLTGDPLFLSTELRDEAVYARATGDSAGAVRATAHLAALRKEE
jgi:DNA-binding SARP family transcriptional activator